MPIRIWKESFDDLDRPGLVEVDPLTGEAIGDFENISADEAAPEPKTLEEAIGCTAVGPISAQ